MIAAFVADDALTLVEIADVAVALASDLANHHQSENFDQSHVAHVVFVGLEKWQDSLEKAVLRGVASLGLVVLLTGQMTAVESAN